MTNPSYTHYVLIVDRSGSMGNIREEAQNGIRHFVREQAKLPGKATVSLYQFDNVHDTVYDFVPLDQVKPYSLVPRNMTALLDACGFAITQVGERLAAMPEAERPGKVVVLITTDGLENCSCEYTRDQVREMITRQSEQFAWQFSYVGANQDAFAEGGSIGVSMASSLNYAATSGGTQSAYDAVSRSASRYVGGQSASLMYTDDERTAAEDSSKLQEKCHG